MNLLKNILVFFNIALLSYGNYLILTSDKPFFDNIQALSLFSVACLCILLNMGHIFFQLEQLYGQMLLKSKNKGTQSQAIGTTEETFMNRSTEINTVPLEKDTPSSTTKKDHTLPLDSEKK